jgi:5-(aminomethyl)-3-furanmethanol phosphate kinase
MSPTVVKVGGSLYDLPDLGPRLRYWLAKDAPPRVLLVPGGGPTADVVRAFDQRFRLGEEAAHWLALRALTVNAHLLAELVGGPVVGDWGECPAAWGAGRVPVLDGFAFAAADEVRPDHLPHSWAVTSDSLAARAAVVGEAGRLILLKSVGIPEGIDWSEAARRGWVDAWFPSVLRQRPGLRVTTIAFRDPG